MQPNTESGQEPLSWIFKWMCYFPSSDKDGELVSLTKYQQILNMTSSMAAGLLYWIALYCTGVFFSIDNEQPKHVILSACQVCSQRTSPARMWCCQSLPKSINCTNRGRHTIWQQPWKTNSNYFLEKRVFTQLPLSTKEIHAVNICQCQKWQKNITEETEHVSLNQVFVYSH